jgi:DNA-directed RNA polymerase subunit RPC12/RpoP
MSFEKKPKCPYCGSKMIIPEKKGFHFKPHMLFTGIFGMAAEAVKSQQVQWHCQKCDETFEIGEEE